MAYLTSTEIYNVNDDQFIDGPSLETTTAAACAAIHPDTNQIYFVGGFLTNNLYSKATQIFDIKTRTFLPPITSQLTTGRCQPACGIFEETNSLVAAGGSTPQWAPTNTVEVLNLNTKIWSSAKPMPSAGTMWNPNGLIFMKSLELYQYEPRDDQWLLLVDVPFDLSDLNIQCQVFNAGNGRTCQFT